MALYLNLRDPAFTHKHLKRTTAKRDGAYRTEWILK